MEEQKEPLIKSANDLKIEITKLNGEKVVDEECCTSIVLMLKNSGEIGTSFLGAHNSDILRAMKKAINKYLRLLKKSLKTAPSDENIVVNKDKELAEENKLTKNSNTTSDNSDLKTNPEEKNIKPKKHSTSKKSPAKKKSSPCKSKNTSNKNLSKNQSNTENKTAEQQSIDEVQEIIKDIKRMQDSYKNKK